MKASTHLQLMLDYGEAPEIASRVSEGSTYVTVRADGASVTFSGDKAVVVAFLEELLTAARDASGIGEEG